MQYSTTTVLNTLIDRLKSEKRYWECFNIAKISFQYGYYNFSSDLFGFLSEKAESELNYFFLNAMFNICTGEYLLKQSFNLSDALIYIKASRDDLNVNIC